MNADRQIITSAKLNHFADISSRRSRVGRSMARGSRRTARRIPRNTSRRAAHAAFDQPPAMRSAPAHANPLVTGAFISSASIFRKTAALGEAA